MAISFDKFKNWAIARFGEDNVLVKGKEIRINSVFVKDDENHHLWCSPSGGKNKRNYGVFHCFKTDQKGSLIKLVQIVDHCDKDDAFEILNGRTSIRELEKKLEEYLNQEEEKQVETKINQIYLPEHSFLISSLPSNNWWRKKAEEHLNPRKIQIDGLYICTDGKYKARIIIPYYDKQGNLIYFNGRHIGNSKCKYLGPPKEIGVGKEDVIFMAGKWPEAGSTIYLCEGEFNAISLNLAEFNSAACGGKNMGEKQALLLSNYKIVICLDRDKAGKQGTSKMASVISSLETVKGADKLSFVMPPEGYNDWNDMLKALGPVLLHHYIIKNTKPIDYSWPYGTHLTYMKNLLD
jgi:DNA primase